MKDEAPDRTAAPRALKAAVHHFVWIADLARGELSPDDAETVRRHREDIQVSRDQLLETLSRVAPDEATEIERCVAQLLHAADRIQHLSPLPTPNVRKRIRGENPRRMRAAKAKTPEAVAIDKACETVFAEYLKGVSSDWDGKTGIWTMAGLAATKINKSLDDQGIKGLSQDQIRRRLGTFIKDRI